MSRMKRNSLIQKLIRVVLCISCIPIIYLTANFSLPYLETIFADAAALSAGISFLEGGRSVMEQEGYWDADTTFGDTQDVPYVDYEESASSIPNSSQNQSSVPASSMVPKPENAGTILRKTYTAGSTKVYIPLKNGYIKNCTSISAEKIAKTVKSQPSFQIKADQKPEVLIMHTHTTESYQMQQVDWFTKESSSRTTDKEKNVVRVANEIEKQLKAAGIGVIHDTTLHDYPSYNGSYERSAITVKKILKENPTIKVVLDVHRDAIQPDANTMISPVTTIDGKPCAQVMIISGCDNGKMNMPNYMENLKLSASLQQNMEKDYPTLTRPILFDYRKYNQDLTTGSILLEMGGHANTLDEAIYAGELVGKSLVKSLLALK